MLNKPPVGQHAWRQIVGYAAARNYYEEDNRFFYPRADIRMSKEDAGAIYHELPTTYWLVAQTYRFFGENNAAARVIPFAFNLLTLLGAFGLARALGYSDTRSLLFVFFLVFSPLFFYYAPSLVPNQLGLTFFLCGMALLLPAVKREQWGIRFVLAIGVVTIATLTKPTYLFYGLLLAFVFVYQYWQSRRLSTLAAAGIAASVILTVNYLVIEHARKLYESSPIERQIHTPISGSESPRDLAHVFANIEPAITKWLFEMLINLAAIPFFVVGLYLILRRPSLRPYSHKFWLAWGACFVIFCGIFIVRLADHDYYLTSGLALTAALSSLGADHLFKSVRYRKLVFVLGIAVMAVGATRVYGRWFTNLEIPAALTHRNNEIIRHIPSDDLVLISGDKSPITFLYYLHRKGFSLDSNPGPLASVNLQPFSWLVHYQKAHPLPDELTAVFSLTPVDQVEDFAVYQLKPKDLQ